MQKVWQGIFQNNMQTTCKQHVKRFGKEVSQYIMAPVCVYFFIAIKIVGGKNKKANAQISKDMQSQNLLAFHGRANNLYVRFWSERNCFRQLLKATFGLKNYKSNKKPRVYIHVGASSRPMSCTGADAMHESAAEVSG